MHLVLLNQYYPPDAAPTGVMLEGLARGLLENGHDVTVLCSAGGYAGSGGNLVIRDQLSGIRDCEGGLAHGAQASSSIPKPRSTNHDLPSPRIIRIRASRFGRGTFGGKLLDYVSYFIGAGWKLATLRPRPDRVVALTTPPYLAVLARTISKVRGADHAHWVMDAYPDVMAAHGMLAETRWIYRILQWLTRWGYGGRRCAAVLTLGPDMAQRVSRHVSASRRDMVQWVPLWAADDLVGDGRADRPRSADLSPAGRETNVHADSSSPQGENRGAPGRHALPTTGNHQAMYHNPASLELRRQRGWGDGELIVMYSGNMGLGHRFTEILAAANALAEGRVVGEGGADRPRSADFSPTGRDAHDQDHASRPQAEHHGAPGRHALPTTDNRQPITLPLRLVFFGGGKRRDEIRNFIVDHPECRIELHDYAPADDLTTHLQSADVHLASLDAKWTGTMVPSKLQGIFSAGRPVIFIGSTQSSIGRWVYESGGGWVVEPGNVDGLLAALTEAADASVREPRGRAAMAYAGKHFDQATNVARIVAVLGTNR